MFKLSSKIRTEHFGCVKTKVIFLKITCTAYTFFLRQVSQQIFHAVLEVTTDIIKSVIKLNVNVRIRTRNMKSRIVKVIHYT